MVYSTGGFCAVNLAVHHPERYRSAVSLSGYFRALTDPTTGPLFKTLKDRQYNSPLLQLSTPRPIVNVLAICGTQDHRPLRDATAFVLAARGTAVHVQLHLAPGGHNFPFWTNQFPYAFSYLGTVLPAPTQAPALSTK